MFTILTAWSLQKTYINSLLYCLNVTPKNQDGTAILSTFSIPKLFYLFLSSITPAPSGYVFVSYYTHYRAERNTLQLTRELRYFFFFEMFTILYQLLILYLTKNSGKSSSWLLLSIHPSRVGGDKVFLPWSLPSPNGVRLLTPVSHNSCETCNVLITLSGQGPPCPSGLMPFFSFYGLQLTPIKVISGMSLSLATFLTSKIINVSYLGWPLFPKEMSHHIHQTA